MLRVFERTCSTSAEAQASRSCGLPTHWKNEAAAPGAADKWGAAKVERMRTDRAPQRYNADKGGMESMELSHEPIPARDGGTQVVPRWPQDHGAIGPFRHPGY